MAELELILAALVAGAATATSEMASGAVRNAYGILISSIRRRLKLSHRSTDLLEVGGVSDEGQRKLLMEGLTTSGADQDSEILAAARQVLALTHAQSRHGMPDRLPHQVGIVPVRADCRQHRPVDQAIASFASRGDDTATNCQILSGMGGVGKTQLVANYASWLWREKRVDLLVWVTADSRNSILLSYARAGGDLTGLTDEDPAVAAARFLTWLSEKPELRWLIVFDDLQQPADLNGLWPPLSRSGRAIVTTRRRDAALVSGRHLIEVSIFDPAESLSYLAARLDGDWGRLSEAPELAEDLGHLPLALAQATAYILDRGLSCADYRRRLIDRRRSLHDLTPEWTALPDEHRTSIPATWSLSIELADQFKPAGLARPILEIAALLDPNAVPADLFATDAVVDYLTQHVSNGSGIVDQADINDVLHGLHRLNLVNLTPTGSLVRIHALIQRAVRESIPVERSALLVAVTSEALLQVWPPVETDASQGQALRANAAALRLIAGSLLWDRERGPHRVLLIAGTSLGEAGLVGAAKGYFDALKSEATQEIGSDHPATLTIRENIARWQGESGDTTGAARILGALLSDRFRVQGPAHLDTLKTRGNLARWRGESGEAASALTMTRDLLIDTLRILGPDHRHTLTTRHNLAFWQGEAGDPEGAATEFDELLVDMERVLGKDHPDTLTTRNDVGCWRGIAGDAMGAAAALEALLPDRRRVFGPLHLHTFITRNDLAWWRGLAGDPHGAASAFHHLLSDMERVLGPDHPRTLTARNNLAWWRGATGQITRAVTGFEELLPDRLRVLGPDHPHTMITRGSLAYWIGRAGNPAAAVEALEDLLRDRLRVMGANHPHVATTRRHLGYWRAAVTGLPSVTAGQDLLADIFHVIGPEHSDTLTIWSYES